MLLDEWRFSSRLAWEDPVMRWLALSTLVILIASSIYAGIRLFSLSFASGFVVTHYTVYLGIDQVLPTIWLLPILIVPVVLISGTIAIGYYNFRQDGLSGYGLLALSSASTVIWIIQLFHLIKINI